MGGVLVLLVLAVAALAVWGQVSKRMAHVRDASGRPVAPGPEAARGALTVVAVVALLLLLTTTFRVVPVGQGLVIFNTVAKTFTQIGRAHV